MRFREQPPQPYTTSLDLFAWSFAISLSVSLSVSLGPSNECLLEQWACPARSKRARAVLRIADSGHSNALHRSAGLSEQTVGNAPTARASCATRVISGLQPADVAAADPAF